MNTKASPRAIESAAAWTAAMCLGGAVGFAVARIAPLGAGLAEAGGAGTLVALAAGLIVRRIGGPVVPRDRATPPESLNDLLFGEKDEAVLELRAVDDVLLLDDPLPAVDEESRVVRLFAAPPGNGDVPLALAGPGEMIARIEDFLGHPRGSEAQSEPNRRADPAAADDASAALHAALADIRRSLKQG